MALRAKDHEVFRVFDHVGMRRSLIEVVNAPLTRLALSAAKLTRLANPYDSLGV
jgi:hypothetical protein